jgi:hypothetical protein
MSPKYRGLVASVALCIAATIVQSDMAMADEAVVVRRRAKVVRVVVERPLPVYAWGWGPTEQVATTTAAHPAPGTIVVGVPLARRTARYRSLRTIASTRPNSGGYYYTTDGERVFLNGPGDRVLW